MKTTQILIAGFGGQGVLFAGKFLAYKGLLEDKQVSWLPSYGPEMRGGTANCSIILSDDPVGSPIVSTPDALIAMNLPSFDKYEGAVAPGGKVFVDSTLIAPHLGHATMPGTSSFQWELRRLSRLALETLPLGTAMMTPPKYIFTLTWVY